MKEKSILPTTWQIPDSIRNRLGSSVGRQRMMLEEGHLLLVLHAPPKPEENERAGRLFWRKPDGSWTSNELGNGINALLKHLDDYAKFIETLDQREEKAVTADELFEILEVTAPIFRASKNLYQVMEQVRTTCPDFFEIIDVRNRAYSIQRTAELLYDGTKNSLDFVVAKRAEEEAQVSRHRALSAHRLNSLAAFFFPVATLTAIFGTNLRSGLESAEPPYALLGVIGVGLLLGAILNAVISRPPKA